MTPVQLARAAEQQRLAQIAHLDDIRRAATARGTRVGPGPDRVWVHQQ